MSALVDPDTCERIFHAALASGDAQGVDAALRVMAVQDPHRAQRLYDALRVGLEIARASFANDRAARAALSRTEPEETA